MLENGWRIKLKSQDQFWINFLGNTIHRLDPHSTFLPVDEVLEQQENRALDEVVLEICVFPATTDHNAALKTVLAEQKVIELEANEELNLILAMKLLMLVLVDDEEAAPELLVQNGDFDCIQTHQRPVGQWILELVQLVVGEIAGRPASGQQLVRQQQTDLQRLGERLEVQVERQNEEPDRLAAFVDRKSVVNEFGK